MSGGPVIAPNRPDLRQFNQDRELITDPTALSGLNIPFPGFGADTMLADSRKLGADTLKTANQVDKVFGAHIGKYKNLGDDLHKQFDAFLNAGSADLKALPKEQQFEAFVKFKEEQAMKMLVDALDAKKPSGLPADYQANKEYYNNLYKAAIAPKISEMFGQDVRLARHRADLYGDGDAKVTKDERAQMAQQVAVLLKKPSEAVAQEPTATTAVLTNEQLIKQAVTALLEGVNDPASAPDNPDTQTLTRKAVSTFDKMIEQANKQLIDAGKPELTKEQQAELLKQFNEAIKSDPIGGLQQGLVESIAQYMDVREQVKAYQALLEEHKKTTDDPFYRNQSPEIKQAILDAQARQIEEFTSNLSNKLSISNEDAKTILENIHNPSPDVGSVGAVTLALLNQQADTQAAQAQTHAQHQASPASAELKQEVFGLLEGNVFNQKFPVPGPNGTPQQASIRELVAAETADKISKLTGTPEEIEKQKQELLKNKEEINTKLDRAYASAIYQKRYQEAYDKAFAAAGGAGAGEAALKAAQEAGTKAGQAAFDYLSKRDTRGSLKEFNPAAPTTEFIQHLQTMAYDVRLMVGHPIPEVVSGKPPGSAA